MNKGSHTQDRSWPRRVVCTLLVVAAIPSLVFILSLFGLFPWSGVNCCQDDIDITSGRTRHTCYLFWIAVTRTMTDSALTKALSPQDRIDLREEWHPVVTFSPGVRHSPHYRFHGATYEIRELETCWEYGEMGSAARRETAKHLLQLWQQAGNDFQAKDYVQSLWEQAQEAKKKGEPIDVGDLPTP